MASGLLLFGSPGSGKNGIGKLLNLYGIQHLVTGDIFRSIAEKAEDGDPVAQKYFEIMSAAELVDDSTTMKLLRFELEPVGIEKSFLFDSPRSPEQVKIFCEEVAPSRGLDMTIGIYLDATRENCRHRLLDRAKKEPRPDNGPDVIEKRLDKFDTYKGSTLFELKRLTKFIRIDANGEMMMTHMQILSQLVPLLYPLSGTTCHMTGMHNGQQDHRPELAQSAHS